MSSASHRRLAKARSRFRSCIACWPSTCNAKDYGMSPEGWPTLPYDAWKDTYATLHMWSQIVGKIALARAAPLNHSWGIALDVTARGLTTRTLPHGNRSFRVAFDFIDHQLVIEASDGNRRTLPLSPRTVAAFCDEAMATLRERSEERRVGNERTH